MKNSDEWLRWFQRHTLFALADTDVELVKRTWNSRVKQEAFTVDDVKYDAKTKVIIVLGAHFSFAVQEEFGDVSNEFQRNPHNVNYLNITWYTLSTDLLPKDIWMHVLSFLKPRHIINFRYASKFFASIALSNVTWRQYALRNERLCHPLVPRLPHLSCYQQYLYYSLTFLLNKTVQDCIAFLLKPDNESFILLMASVITHLEPDSFLVWRRNGKRKRELIDYTPDTPTCELDVVYKYGIMPHFETAIYIHVRRDWYVIWPTWDVCKRMLIMGVHQIPS